MPWNDKSGGGGPWGGGGGNGGGGGPWGQGPRGPGGPQGNPPDLEDIIRRGQDRLKQALPGGGGAEPSAVRPDFRRSWRCASSSRSTPCNRTSSRSSCVSESRSRSSRAGSALPLVADRNGRIRQHRRKAHPGGEARGNTSSGLMLSGDQNIVDVRFSIACRSRSPGLSLHRVRPDEMVRQIGESAMREAVGRRPAQWTSSATTAGA